MKRSTTKPGPTPHTAVEQFHTVSGVAVRLNVCDRTVRRLIKAGLLKEQRVGRAVRFGEGSLQAYLGERK